MKKKNLMVLLLVITLVISMMPIAASAATKWTARQEQAHAIADQARSMGYCEESAAIKVMQDIFAWESGDKSVNDSYYYSGRTKQFYKLNVECGTVINEDGSYFDGTYFWYLDSKSGYYYRFDKNGKKITGEKATRISGGVGDVYDGHYLWNGVITGVDKYINTGDAEKVAKFIMSYSYMTNKTTTQKAELAWLILNCQDGGTLQGALDKFEDYNSKADLTTAEGKDALAIAKDVLFRAYVEGRTDKNVGRVLPEKYVWMWYDGTVLYLRSERNGANWDHNIKSPYK